MKVILSLVTSNLSVWHIFYCIKCLTCHIYTFPSTCQVLFSTQMSSWSRKVLKGKYSKDIKWFDNMTLTGWTHYSYQPVDNNKCNPKIKIGMFFFYFWYRYHQIFTEVSHSRYLCWLEILQMNLCIHLKSFWINFKKLLILSCMFIWTDKPK